MISGLKPAIKVKQKDQTGNKIPITITQLKPVEKYDFEDTIYCSEISVNTSDEQLHMDNTRGWEHFVRKRVSLGNL